jgi:vanillate O-demethylase monooxygenase subunit
VIFGQDQVVVESQRPEQVPFDLAAELHLKFDAVAVSYRRAMRDTGLAVSAGR